MKQTMISALLATALFAAPVAANGLSGSRPGTYLPQVKGEFKPSEEMRTVLDGLRLWVANHCDDNAEVMEVYDRLILAMGKDGAFNDRRYFQTIDALFCAAEKHQYDVRPAPPFLPHIVHPMGVALILWEEEGVRDPNAITAALLHDAKVWQTELELRFGNQVASYVSEVAEGKGIVSAGGKQIKMAEKLYDQRNFAVRTPVEFVGDEMIPVFEANV